MFPDSYGKLWGAPCKKRIYDWLRMGWVECTCIDVGRSYSIGVLASPYDDPNYQPPDKPQVGRPNENFQKVHDWLKENGPAFTSDIAEGVALPISSVSTIIRRHAKEFQYTMSIIVARDGGQRWTRLWEVAE